MALVLLGGLVTSTLLSLFVVPALYLRFARPRAEAETSSAPMTGLPAAAPAGGETP